MNNYQEIIECFVNSLKTNHQWSLNLPSVEVMLDDINTSKTYYNKDVASKDTFAIMINETEEFIYLALSIKSFESSPVYFSDYQELINKEIKIIENYNKLYHDITNIKYKKSDNNPIFLFLSASFESPSQLKYPIVLFDDMGYKNYLYNFSFNEYVKQLINNRFVNINLTNNNNMSNTVNPLPWMNQSFESPIEKNQYGDFLKKHFEKDSNYCDVIQSECISSFMLLFSLRLEKNAFFTIDDKGMFNNNTIINSINSYINVLPEDIASTINLNDPLFFDDTQKINNLIDLFKMYTL